MSLQYDTFDMTGCPTSVQRDGHSQTVVDALSARFRARLRQTLSGCTSVLLLIILQGCASATAESGFFAAVSGLFPGAVSTEEISFSNPPALNTWLEPQPHLVVCKNEHSAVAMALTGLFVPDCQLLDSSNTYKTVSIVRRDFGDNQLVWMVTVESPQGIQWVPVPWHNWV